MYLMLLIFTRRYVDVVGNSGKTESQTAIISHMDIHMIVYRLRFACFASSLSPQKYTDRNIAEVNLRIPGKRKAN